MTARGRPHARRGLLGRRTSPSFCAARNLYQAARYSMSRGTIDVVGDGDRGVALAALEELLRLGAALEVRGAQRADLAEERAVPLGREEGLDLREPGRDQVAVLLVLREEHLLRLPAPRRGRAAS